MSGFYQRSDHWLRYERLTVAIHDGVEFRVQATFGGSDTVRNAPFLRRLAAVLWAFRWVVSIIKVCGLQQRSHAASSR